MVGNQSGSSSLRYSSEQGPQMSEAFITIFFLSLSGGLQDAYTYVARGHVFANAQTGNIVLLSVSLYKQDWQRVLYYLVPLCFFAVGVALAVLFRHFMKNMTHWHWRQGVLLIEMILLSVVACLPVQANLWANALVSLACAMQIQTFKTVKGYGFASTMCIGNLRSGTEALIGGFLNQDNGLFKKSGYYFGVIIS